MRVVACVLLCLVFSFSVHSQERSLVETVSIAVDKHPRIKVQQNETEIQRAALLQVEANSLPTISIGLGIGPEVSQNATTRATGDERQRMVRRESSVKLTQLLYDGDQTQWQELSQEEKVNAEAHKLAQVAEQTALDSIRAHLSVAVADHILNYTITNLETHQKIANDISARARSGKDDRAKVSQIKARLALSFANVEAAKAKVLKANSDYHEIVGEEANVALALVEGRQLIEGTDYLPKTLSQLVDSALQGSHQILASQKQREAASAAAKSARSLDYPSLYLESGASWNDNLDGVEGRNQDAFVMLRLRYDLYSGGAKPAQRKQALVESRKAEHAFDEVSRSVRRQAEHAWHNYHSSLKRVEFLEQYRDAAETTRKAYEKQFNIGQRSLIDLLDAENEWLQARSQAIQARQDLILAAYQVASVQGELLPLLGIDVSFSE